MENHPTYKRSVLGKSALENSRKGAGIRTGTPTTLFVTQVEYDLREEKKELQVLLVENLRNNRQMMLEKDSQLAKLTAENDELRFQIDELNHSNDIRTGAGRGSSRVDCTGNQDGSAFEDPSFATTTLYISKMSPGTQQMDLKHYFESLCGVDGVVSDCTITDSGRNGFVSLPEKHARRILSDKKKEHMICDSVVKISELFKIGTSDD